MKRVRQIRLFFQFLAFLSLVLVIGSAGAWESGSINFLQLLLQFALFSGTGFFCSEVAKKRIVVRVLPRPNRRDTPPVSRRITPVRAA